jgi:two-component system KDP operon response regulator KdpE
MSKSPGQALPPLVGLDLLIVSADPESAQARIRHLEEFGYRVAICGEPPSVAKAIGRRPPGAIVVDMAHEVANAADLVRRIRRITSVPLLVVGCAGTSAEMLRCLDAGADEYTSPRCPTQEVDLRLRALFRRMGSNNWQGAKQQVAPIRAGDLEIDMERQIVRKRGTPVALSPTEFRLLATLAENCGRVIPAKALIARVWGNEYVAESHYLRLYVRYLRQKLEDDPGAPRYILNRWGAGYSLAEQAKAA